MARLIELLVVIALVVAVWRLVRGRRG